MPRPSKPKRVCGMPRCRKFSGETHRENTQYLALSVEEFETVRLIDYQGMTQEACAASMGVSRVTVQTLYAEARKKLARFLVEGSGLVIEGGNYLVESQRDCDRKGCGNAEKGACDMIIAVTYENGEVFQHFGHTETFKLYQVEDHKVVSSRILGTGGNGHGALAGFLREQQVDVLICGGIGAGARNALAEAGIQLYGGACGDADAQVESFLAGSLAYDPEAECSHHHHEGGEGGCGHGKCGE